MMIERTGVVPDARLTEFSVSCGGNDSRDLSVTYAMRCAPNTLNKRNIHKINMNPFAIYLYLCTTTSKVEKEKNLFPWCLTRISESHTNINNFWAWRDTKRSCLSNTQYFSPSSASNVPHNNGNIRILFSSLPSNIFAPSSFFGFSGPFPGMSYCDESVCILHYHAVLYECHFRQNAKYIHTHTRRTYIYAAV